MTFYRAQTVSRGDESPASPSPIEVVLQAPPVSRAELQFYAYCALSLLLIVCGLIYGAWTDKHFTEVSTACVLDIAVGAAWFAVLQHRKRQNKNAT